MASDLPLSNHNDCNYIKDSIVKIDKLQKEVIHDKYSACVTCETSLFTSAYNTIPVSFYTCCGNAISGLTCLEGNSTTFFRIESIRCCKYVTVRLLEVVSCDGRITLIGTNNTMIIDIECIGSLQCFAPVCIDICTNSTPAPADFAE